MKAAKWQESLFPRRDFSVRRKGRVGVEQTKENHLEIDNRRWMINFHSGDPFGWYIIKVDFY